MQTWLLSHWCVCVCVCVCVRACMCQTSVPPCPPKILWSTLLMLQCGTLIRSAQDSFHMDLIHPTESIPIYPYQMFQLIHINPKNLLPCLMSMCHRSLQSLRASGPSLGPLELHRTSAWPPSRPQSQTLRTHRRMPSLVRRMRRQKSGSGWSGETYRSLRPEELESLWREI